MTPEYMLWWIKQAPLATPLIITSTNPLVFDANGNSISGGLGVPGTIVLFSSSNLNYNPFSGGRLSLGGWLDDDRTVGLSARGFLLQQKTIRAFASSDAGGDPIVGVPIFDVFNVVSGGENAVTESFPLATGLGTGFAGTEAVISRSQLWGGNADVNLHLFGNESFTFNGLLGFRYADLREDITLIGQSTNLVDVNGFPIPGGVSFLNNFFNGTVTSYDTWTTRNQFLGGEIGAQAEVTFANFFVNLTGTVGLGSTHEVVQIGGVSTLQATIGTIPPPFPTIASGGTLALQNNSGRFIRNTFSVLPEVDVKIGYELTKSLRFFGGYSYLYWSQVARPGDQIDRRIDLRQVPTISIPNNPFNPELRNTLPPPSIHTSSFWAQGITFGVQLAF